MLISCIWEELPSKRLQALNIMTRHTFVQKMHAYYVQLISSAIWKIEKITFYPKVATWYREYLQISHGVHAREEELVIFDVGANKGQSVKFFKQEFPQSKIYAFEPSQTTFSKLLLNIADYQNVIAFMVGVSSSNGHLMFYENELDETSTFNPPHINSKYLKTKNRILLQKNQQYSNMQACPVVTLDDTCKELKISNISILKIDVEGHEFEVLKGAQEMLSKNQISLIQLERHSDDMRDDDTPELVALLNKYGYRKVGEIQHSFGSFFDDFYGLSGY